MGTYRSSYTMTPEGNRNAPPNFQWFHPSFFSTSRIGFNPFQGSQFSSSQDVRGSPSSYNYTTIPVQLGPPDDEAVPLNNKPTEAAGLGHAAEPSTRTKKSKTSKNSTTDPTITPKPFKPKQSKRNPSKPPKKTKPTTTPSSAKHESKDLMNFANVDPSGVPAPFCSCTGVARQCYRWGAGGWQSSCCTTNISEYPLPMNATRPGSRLAGRKMSHGAYQKLIQRLAAEGCDLSRPVDLRQHWARHGTNKFVTIK